MSSPDRGLERFKTEQPPYRMLVRGIEADVLPTAQRHGMGVIPWSPLAGGWLSGRYRKGQDAPSSTRAGRLPSRYDLSLPGNQRKLDAADQLGALADEAGIPLVELAIAWVINHPAITSAIIGPRTMAHLESQLPAARARSTARCWTASTRSSRRRRASTTPTPATRTLRWSPAPDGGELS